MSKSLWIGLAQTREQRLAAFGLLGQTYQSLGIPTVSPELWLTKRHMLPSNATLIACLEGELVAAVSFFCESALGLPIEDHLSLQRLKESQGRCAELSCIGLSPLLDPQSRCKIIEALFRYSLVYAAQYLGLSHLLTQFPNPSLQEACPHLYFQALTLGTKNILHKDLSKLEPLQALWDPDREDFHFPERNFFETQDSFWNLEDFHFFFVEKTRLFSELNEGELQALQNIYDFGEFAILFNKRRSIIGKQQKPKEQRFLSNCHASLVKAGKPLHLDVLDVSRFGLRARSEEPLEVGTHYALQVAVGTLKAAEIIAVVVWQQRHTGQLGLRVCNNDSVWQEWLNYLEHKAKRTAWRANP